MLTRIMGSSVVLVLILFLTSFYILVYRRGIYNHLNFLSLKAHGLEILVQVNTSGLHVLHRNWGRAPPVGKTTVHAGPHLRVENWRINVSSEIRGITDTFNTPNPNTNTAHTPVVFLFVIAFNCRLILQLIPTVLDSG